MFDLSANASTYGLNGSGYEKVLGAVLVYGREGGYSGSTTFKLHNPTAWSWAGAVGGGQLATATGTTEFSYDVTAKVKLAYAASNAGISFGLSGDPTGTYNFKDLGVGLAMVINDAPPAPTISASSAASGEQWFARSPSSVPTLAVNTVVDTTLAPGQSALDYKFAVATNVADAVAVLVTSRTGLVRHRRCRRDQLDPAEPERRAHLLLACVG